MYRLIYDEDVQKQLAALPKSLQQRIADKILISTQQPHHFFRRLKGKAEYRLRVGDWRIVADIDDRNQLLTVHVIGHRKDIYDR